MQADGDNEAQLQGDGGGGGGAAAAPIQAAAPAAQAQQQQAQGVPALVSKLSKLEQFMDASLALSMAQQEMHTKKEVNQLGKPQNKEFARLLIAVAQRGEESERTALARAAIEAIRMLETDADVEEPNKVIRTVIRRFRGLSTEEQEDLFDEVKLRKRKAQQEGCNRCGRDNHTESKCYATQHVSTGAQLSPQHSNKRARYGNQQQQQQPQQQQHWGGYGPSYGPPMQQQYQQAPQGGGPAYVPYGQRQYTGCHNCGGMDHKAFQCRAPPSRQGQGNAPPPAARPPAAQVREAQQRETARAVAVSDQAAAVQHNVSATSSAVQQQSDPLQRAVEAVSVCDAFACSDGAESFAEQYVDGAFGWKEEETMKERQEKQARVSNVAVASASSAAQVQDCSASVVPN